MGGGLLLFVGRTDIGAAMPLIKLAQETEWWESGEGG
jgi:hypothetical protein